MGRPGKAKHNGESRGRSVPARQDIKILETADTPEDEIDRTEPAQSAADRTETAQSTADKESPSLTGTDQHNNKQTPLTKADLIKKVEVIRQDLITTTLVLDTLPESLNGPLATIVAEMRRSTQ